MSKFLYLSLIAVLLIPTLAAGNTNSDEPIAIIHYDKLKEAKLDGCAADLTLKPRLGLGNQVSYAILENNLLTPRQVTVSILGLTKPEYDLYVIDASTRKPYEYPPPSATNRPSFLNTKDYLIGTRKKEDLEAGISISFEATRLDPAYREYIERLRARCEEGLKRYTSPYDEPGVCNSVMKGIVGWIDSIKTADQQFRSATILVVPSKEPFIPTAGGFLPPPPSIQDTKELISKSIQLTRKDIVKLVKNPMYQADALDVITPVEFKLVGNATAGKKVVFKAILTNWTDRPITGSVALFTPSKWKVKGISTSIKMPGYAKTSTAKFEVTVPKTAKPNSSISATATLKIETVKITLLAKAQAK